MANMIGWLPQVIKHYSSLDLISFFLWRKFFFFSTGTQYGEKNLTNSQRGVESGYEIDWNSDHLRGISFDSQDHSCS